MADIQELSVVALLEDIPSEGLRRGEVGTVVAVLSPSEYEVEFIDLKGQTYGLVPLKASQLMRLHFEPTGRAA